MIIDYACVKNWSKFLMIISSAGLVALGIGRFFTSLVLTDPMQYILSIYFILLGLLLIGMEFGWERILKNFEFYRYFFGKAFFSLFLGLLSFNQDYWYQIVVSSVFFFDTLLFIVLGFGCMSSESENLNAGHENQAAPENKI